MAVAFLDHAAPIGRRWWQSQAEEAERADVEGGVADAQQEVHDQRAAAVGQDLAQHDHEVAVAAQFGGGHVFARADGILIVSGLALI